MTEPDPIAADWRALSQEALDAAYDQAAYAPNMQQVIQRCLSESARTRQRLGEPCRLAYGPGPNERLDWFAPPGASGPAPVHIFVHGGAWRQGSAAMFSFVAEPFVRAGACAAVLDFDAVQDHAGDLQPMADQVATALAWIARKAAAHGGNPNRLYLSAHSSGAHLAASALTGMAGREPVPPGTIKGALLCGGLYDLAPVRASARSSYVSLSDGSEQRLSPIRHLDRWRTPAVIAYGGLETPEFQRQSAEFADALAARGLLDGRIFAPHHNHFEVLETLANPYGLLGAAALAQMARGA